MREHCNACLGTGKIVVTLWVNKFKGQYSGPHKSDFCCPMCKEASGYTLPFLCKPSPHILSPAALREHGSATILDLEFTNVSFYPSGANSFSISRV
jgi:hypothetical protein